MAMFALAMANVMATALPILELAPIISAYCLSISSLPGTMAHDIGRQSFGC